MRLFHLRKVLQRLADALQLRRQIVGRDHAHHAEQIRLCFAAAFGCAIQHALQLVQVGFKQRFEMQPPQSLQFPVGR